MEARYLGDGVYASFDGYHINLAVNHHKNHVISLEPQVMDALKQYERDIDEELNIKKSELDVNEN